MTTGIQAQKHGITRNWKSIVSYFLICQKTVLKNV